MGFLASPCRAPGEAAVLPPGPVLVVVRSAILFAAALATGLAIAQDADYPHGDFEGDCEVCHSEEGFRPARITPEFRRDHPFPLRQAHDLDDCRACHTPTLDFTKASPSCVDCHLDPHRGEMGLDCAQCHVPRTFIDRTRMQRSHQQTRFPLRGSHRALDCEDCHDVEPPGALRWVNTPVDCVACHGGVFPAFHESAGFPRQCDFCHVPTVWQAARFDHAGIVDGCIDCHLDDYQGTRDPDHVANGFPTDCERCHRPGGSWDDAEFDHAGIVDGCVACHRDDYDATVDPSHAGAGFPTTCEDCHRPTVWSDADFDHSPFFPIETGRHQDRWDSCSTCHINPANFSQFSCFGCHPHSDEDGTRRDHEGEPGFTYDSEACLSCHPRGEA